MKFLLAIIFSLFSISQIGSQSLGKCIKSPVIRDFNATKYFGKWYEIARFNYIFETSNIDCNYAYYGPLNKTAVSVDNYAFNRLTNKTTGRGGYAYSPNLNEPNKLLVVLPVELFNVTFFQGNGPYDVMETDYETYSLVYSCTQVVPDLVKLEIVWILARTSVLDDKIYDYLKERLNNYYKIDTAKLVKIHQNCGF